jgi:hypothetical protein
MDRLEVRSFALSCIKVFNGPSAPRSEPRKPPISQSSGNTSQRGLLLVEALAGDAELAGGAGTLLLVGLEGAA